jgi:hypothetical protein
MRVKVWWLGVLCILALGCFGFTLTEAGAGTLDFGQREAILTRFAGDGYLHGVLVDEAGQPVAGKTVTLIVQRAYGIDCATLECATFNAPVFMAAASSDDRGRFTLHVPARYLAGRGRPCLYIYKLRVDLQLLQAKLFFGLPLAAHESNLETFEVRPPYWTPS